MSGTGGQSGRFAFTQFLSFLLAELPAVSIFSSMHTAFHVIRPLRFFNSGTETTHSVTLGVGAFLAVFAMSALTPSIDLSKRLTLSSVVPVATCGRITRQS